MGSSVASTFHTQVIPSGGVEAVPTADATISITGETEMLPTEVLTKEPTAAPTQATTNEPTDKKPDQPPDEDPKIKNKGEHTALWIVILVFVLGAGGAAAYFLYFKKKK